MKKKESLLNPTLFNQYLKCKYYIVNESLGNSKKKKTKSTLALFGKGNKHEKNYFEILKKNYKNFTEIGRKGSKTDQLDLTSRAIVEGKDLIYQGRLGDESWSGFADFLIKVPKKSKLGNYSYEVIDTKISAQPKPDHIMQLANYSDMLSKIQGCMPEQMHIILRDNKKISINTKESMDYYFINKKNFEIFLDGNYLENTKPEKCNYCQFCDYQEVCKKKWKDEDSLYQIAGIHKSDIKKIQNQNIKTMRSFAKQSKKNVIKDMSIEKFMKVHNQAILQVFKKESGKDKFDLLKLELNRGFNRMPPKGSCDLFFDIEGVPDYVHEGTLQYLFGIKYIEEGKEKFKKFLAHDHDQEKKMLVEFMDFVTDHFKKYKDSYIYHYDDYEVGALDKLTGKYNLKIKAFDDLLRLGKFVDLYKVVREGIQISEDSYSLKNLERFYHFKRSGEVLNAGDSIDNYIEYRDKKNKKILDQIVSYNEQDCFSTLKLRDWLLSVKPEEAKYFVPDKEEVKQLEWEEKILEYQEKINKTKIKDSLKTILSDILGFHRRENRVDWRTLIARRSMTKDELIEIPESIGGLEMIKEPFQVKKSNVFTYKFPPQEYKLQAQDMAINAGANFDSEDAGAFSIVSIDEKKFIIELSRGIKKKQLPKFLNLGPQGPISPNILESSIYSFMDSIIEGTKKYKPLREILTKSFPDIEGVKQESPIINSNDLEKEIPKNILNLKNSYIVLQGPPGTGKTYQAANAIVKLIQQGKKVGVSAHSHKVIHNLLDRIEKTAIEKKVEFKGLKKGGRKEEHIYKGKFINTPEKAQDPFFISALKDKEIQLHAGTVYHFAKGYFDNKLDYLFVDEAGQVSLANLIAMGRAGKNLILIGDQMQLSQPTKGAHPGNSGQSALEYLLEERDTIPTNMGIFIDVTRRLHPNLNSFISSNFYDDRLKHHKLTEKRELIFPEKDKSFQKPGIYYLPIQHQDCSQQSNEEGEMVNKLYKKFLKIKFKDEKGNTKKITVNDILTVSPYNVQVNYLKSILPKDSKVGTIDKFQGQEAPIVIISMTTSDPENLSRHLEFFYSRNRLNVAISRAQCLSLVIMNPELFRLDCSKVSQIKLVNTLLKLNHFKTNFK